MSGAAGAQPRHILDTGISVVYDPQDLPPVVDVVIVHGLHGHPYKSWTAKAPPAELESPTSSLVPSTDTHDDSTGSWRRAIRRLGSNRDKGTASRSKADSWNTTSTSFDEYPAAHEPVFWPADLLPAKCPRARVLTFGYDSKITKYISGATNKGSLASHSKDLLFSICRSRLSDRPIIFVAHSLGGIVVKEMLERSATASEPELKNIVESTAAVVFLGTPHRGSPDLAAMGEYLRSIVSGLRMQTTHAILDSLGLKTTDLERAQEAFSRTWQKYDFRVKTFQEGLGMSGLKLGVLANKVVPDYSSSIGDHREHCETLQANHKEMCRYTGDNDANWRKVSGELCSIYLSILEIHAAGTQLSRHVHLDVRSSQHSSKKAPEPGEKRILNDGEKSILKSLWYPSMYTRMRRIEKPAERTCSWLFEHQSYQDWLTGRNRDQTHGLLWLKGNPGTGKSTLMKEAYNRTMQGQADGDHFTASFFFSAKDSGLAHSTINVWRSLLHQLLPNWPDSLKDFGEELATRFDHVQEGVPDWEEAELKTVFQQAILREKSKKIFIFIDALDECDTARLRNHAYFWRETTSLAYGYNTSLNVCISSRHFPLISLSHCPEIIVERHNNADIAKYVDQRFSFGVGIVDAQWKGLQNRICTRSLGVFLWAVLVVDDLLRKWDDGMDIQYLHKRLDVVPEALESLFYQMMSSVSPKDRMLTARLFQWAILSTKPLRVNEWHHILAFIRHPAPKSLSDWRTSDAFTSTDSQLERQIRSISKGLVEIRSSPEDETPDQALELLSVRAGAGSLNLELGETRTVSVVHKSVRDYFLHGAGFETLIPSLGLQPIGEGHLLIMQTCLDYLAIKELDALVEARRSLQQRSSIVAPGRASTFSTFPGSNPSSDAISQEKTDTVPEPGVSGPLRLSPDLLGNLCTGQGMDVARWVCANDDAFSVKSLTSLNGLAIQVASRSPSSCRSRLLEDYPALLSYATYEFFTHARLAQDDEVRADPIIGLLKFQAGWDRLAALREDIPQGIDLITYAMGAHSLTSWRFAWYQGPDLDYSCLKKFDVRQDRHSGNSSELQRQSAIVNEETEREEPSPPNNMSSIAKILDAAITRGSNQKPGLNKLTQKHMSGQGSVASFSSASSHTGSVDWTYTGEGHKTTGGGIDQPSVIDAHRSAEPRLGSQAPVLATPTILTRFTGRVSICNSDDFVDEIAIDDDDDDDNLDWGDSLEDSNGNHSERNIISLNQLAVSHLQPAQ